MINFQYYLSREWVLGDYECWAFVCDYYQRELGVELPLINIGTFDTASAGDAMEKAGGVRCLFETIDKPEHNCILELGIKTPTHVGVYLNTADAPMVLHCRRKTGGLCQPYSEVTRLMKIFSFNRLKDAPNSIQPEPAQADRNSL